MTYSITAELNLQSYRSTRKEFSFIQCKQKYIAPYTDSSIICQFLHKSSPVVSDLPVGPQVLVYAVKSVGAQHIWRRDLKALGIRAILMESGKLLFKISLSTGLLRLAIS